MGEAQEWLFQPSFNPAVKVGASDDRITSDAGVILLREADHRLGESIVIRVAFRSDRVDRAGFGEAFGVANCEILTGFNRSSQHRFVDSIVNTRRVLPQVFASRAFYAAGC